MQLKGKYSTTYTLEGEKKTIEVSVELKQIDRVVKPHQNLWYAVIILNNKQIEHPDAPYCVNAQYMAEAIVKEEIEKLRKEYGRALRVKRK